eukprot:2350553-Pleurochrysis_carterae.AAC.1
MPAQNTSLSTPRTADSLSRRSPWTPRTHPSGCCPTSRTCAAGTTRLASPSPCAHSAPMDKSSRRS